MAASFRLLVLVQVISTFRYVDRENIVAGQPRPMDTHAACLTAKSWTQAVLGGQLLWRRLGLDGQLEDKLSCRVKQASVHIWLYPRPERGCSFSGCGVTVPTA